MITLDSANQWQTSDGRKLVEVTRTITLPATTPAHSTAVSQTVRVTLPKEPWRKE